MKKTFLFAAVLLTNSVIFAQKSTEIRTPGTFNTIDIAGGFYKLVLQSGNKESVELISNGGDLSKVLIRCCQPGIKYR